MGEAQQQLNSVEDISGQPDYYVNHLAEVNKSKDVVSTEDIVNKHGILIVRKGARISPDVAQKILQHKLVKPLENLVVIDGCVNGNSLAATFSTLLDKHPDMRKIHDGVGYDARFRKILTDPNYDTILIQKLTVLQERQQHEFEKALFCAWLGSLVAVEMGLSSDLVGAAFTAGLMHDVGFLHISPDIVNKPGDLSADEWRAIQSHVVIGQLLLKNMKGIHPRAATAILEHHEHCDGTGYPVGSVAEKLDEIGQIIGMVDSIHAIRMKRFANIGRNLRDAVPYLRMNATTHFDTVYKAMHAALRKADIAPSKVNPLSSYDALVAHLVEHGVRLKHAATVLQELFDLAASAGAEGKKLQRVVQPVVRMMISSGLLRDEIFQWLSSLRDQPDQDALQDLAEMELMQAEMRWQLKKVQRALRGFIDHHAAQPQAVDMSRYQFMWEVMNTSLIASRKA